MAASFRIKATGRARVKPQTGEQRRGRKEFEGINQNTRSLRNQRQHGIRGQVRLKPRVPGLPWSYTGYVGPRLAGPSGHQEEGPGLLSALLQLALEFCCENKSKTNNPILPVTKIKLGHHKGWSKGCF